MTEPDQEALERFTQELYAKKLAEDPDFPFKFLTDKAVQISVMAEMATFMVIQPMLDEMREGQEKLP